MTPLTVVATTPGATSDDKVDLITTLSFHWQIPCCIFQTCQMSNLVYAGSMLGVGTSSNRPLLKCNTASHWLNPHTDWPLLCYYIRSNIYQFCSIYNRALFHYTLPYHISFIPVAIARGRYTTSVPSVQGPRVYFTDRDRINQCRV